MNKKIWQEFIKYGSGWKLEMERNYKKRGTPPFYRLKMYGLNYFPNYEIIDYNLEKLLKQAIKDGNKKIC